jgi:predicted nucleotidyltransferase
MDEASREEVRTRIQAIATRSGCDLVRVLVFGSRARGDHRADSDLDEGETLRSIRTSARDRSRVRRNLGVGFDRSKKPSTYSVLIVVN